MFSATTAARLVLILVVADAVESVSEQFMRRYTRGGEMVRAKGHRLTRLSDSDRIVHLVRVGHIVKCGACIPKVQTRQNPPGLVVECPGRCLQ